VEIKPLPTLEFEIQNIETKKKLTALENTIEFEIKVIGSDKKLTAFEDYPADQACSAQEAILDKNGFHLTNNTAVKVSYDIYFADPGGGFSLKTDQEVLPGGDVFVQPITPDIILGIANVQLDGSDNSYAFIAVCVPEHPAP